MMIKYEMCDSVGGAQTNIGHYQRYSNRTFCPINLYLPPLKSYTISQQHVILMHVYILRQGIGLCSYNFISISQRKNSGDIYHIEGIFVFIHSPHPTKGY